MTPAELRETCLALPQAIETFPFGDDTAVFKTSGNGRIFALVPVGAPTVTVSLKIDPEDGIAVRAQYPDITPGYHLNKKHWVTVIVNAGVPDGLIEELIADSHELVRPKRPKAKAHPE
jgi:predicted DNA-binding protein (MmcQ/YjbR family)